MKKLTTEVDLDTEVAAIAAYIGQKWTRIDWLEDIVREIRDAALHDARAWLSRYDLSLLAYELLNERTAALAPNYEGDIGLQVRYYDAVCHFLSEVSSAADRLTSCAHDLDGAWDYGRRVSALCNRLTARYHDLAAARPLGWEALEEGYNDFDGQDEYDAGADKALFQGTCVESAAAPDFVGRTALPYVMYDEKCQGRKAAYVLVGAVYAQFLGIREFLNTENASQALRELVAEQPAQLLFSFEVKTRDPVLQVLARVATPAPGEAAFNESVASAKAFAALSAAEKQACRAVNELEVTKMLSAMTSRADMDAAEAPRKAHMATTLREVFGS